MIIKTNVAAFQYITSKKSGQEFVKIWVNVPATDGCEGVPVESCVIPRPAVAVAVGSECVVSVDRFGRLNDVQL